VREVFDDALGEKPDQKDRLREEVAVTAAELQDVRVPGGKITEAGVRENIAVALQYLSAWLDGNGAVAIFNLMEDAATAEIARSQLWFWIHRGAALDDGRAVTAELYRAIRDEEAARLEGPRLPAAVSLLDELVLAGELVEFLTWPAYRQLD
jgi:malate synthase